jgi:sortase (surface protein transpeptidase)
MRILLALLAAAAFLTGCTGSTEPATTVPTVVEPIAVAEPVGLDIPSIGVHATGITDLTLDDRGAMEIPADPSVVGWYPLGPAPGETGGAVLTGHVNYNGVPGVFARLHELKPGSRITVPRADNTTVEFEVYATDRYAKDAFPTEQVYGNRPGPELVLITCGGDLDETGHSYKDNIVVSARLAT